jgi:iron complex transport system substrate-binding protein
LTVGEYTGAQARAGHLVAALRQRLTVVADRVAGRHRPAVAVIEWVDPPFSSGHWVPDLVTAAGGRPVAACPGGRSTQASWEQITAAGPEVAVVAPCGFHLDGAAEQAELAARQLPGVPVWAIDADGLIVRPGPRLVDGVEALAAILHPAQAAAAPAGRIRRIA